MLIRIRRSLGVTISADQALVDAWNLGKRHATGPANTK